MNHNNLLNEFESKFGNGGDIRGYFTPGRVNLIGEYTDFNGGYVFPCGLTMGTYMIARKRADRKLNMYSMNFEKKGVVQSSLDEFMQGSEKNWTMYSKGVMWAFEEKGYQLDLGYDFLVYGNIPNGSGLSSSASLEVLTGIMLKDMNTTKSIENKNDVNGIQNLSLQDIALIGQFAENKYVGVNCGIMDQFAVAMAKKDQAIFLDTNNLSFKYVPVKLGNHKIVISSSNKKRSLADSKYNERRSECEKALALLQTKKDVSCLCELTVADFNEIKDVIEDDVLLRRAKHTIYENERTKNAVTALENNNIEEFGNLMKDSHRSLRDDFEVTGIELDLLVEEAVKCEGVVGSRMTGAGFGGCTVSIVRDDCIDSFIEQVGRVYEEKIGYCADFYVAGVGDGAHKIDLEEAAHYDE